MGTTANALKDIADKFNLDRTREEARSLEKFRERFARPLAVRVIALAGDKAAHGDYRLSWRSVVEDAIETPFEDLSREIRLILENQHGFGVEQILREDSSSGGYVIGIELTW